jgi:tetratricopeptide (TPR) repeat protein
VAYHESISIEPESASAWCYLGECLEKLQRWDEAYHAYHEALRRDAIFPDAHVGLGVLADHSGELTKALSHFHRAVELEPVDADFRLLLASAHSKLGQHDAAKEHYAAAVQCNPQSTEAWLERVDHLQCNNLHEEALNICEEALANAPEASDLLYRKFLSLHATMCDTQAYTLLEQLLALHFDGAITLLHLYPALANDARFMERYERFKS